MAVNAYLIIDGIPGPSTSREKAIDILSFSWGASQTATYGVGASGKEAKAGRADLANITIMKVLDKTSPFLFEHCVNGKVIPKVQVFYDKTVNGKQEDYFRITLDDALITSVQLSGSSENPVESISFAYQAIEVAYKAEEEEGTLGAWVPKGFDVAKLEAWAAPA